MLIICVIYEKLNFESIHNFFEYENNDAIKGKYLKIHKNRKLSEKLYNHNLHHPN